MPLTWEGVVGAWLLGGKGAEPFQVVADRVAPFPRAAVRREVENLALSVSSYLQADQQVQLALISDLLQADPFQVVAGR